MIFDSNIQIRGNFNADHHQDIVKNEPMFFNSNLEFAWYHGGEVTRDFIRALPDDWDSSDIVLDSRVHMLMPNWYPCIPGWHHDDVPRTTSTSQPNYINPEYRAEHLMGLVNGDICPTTFIVGNVEVSEPDIFSRQYNVWNNEIDAMLSYPNLIDAPELNVVEAESGKLIEFNCDTFHTGVKAKAGGWRWFVRLSRNTTRQKNITNEIRRQVQVYLSEPMAGW